MWEICRLSDLSFLPFLHFSPVLLLFLDYSPGHASAPYIQTLCDLYCWMSDLHMLYWEHICAYEVWDTEVVKWPSSPELVSTKWWEEVSQIYFFSLIHGCYCIALLFSGEKKWKVVASLCKQSRRVCHSLSHWVLPYSDKRKCCFSEATSSQFWHRLEPLITLKESVEFAL